MGFEEFAFSLRMRDTIEKMVQSSIDRLRPKYRYATVNSIDRTNYKCAVTYNGEANPVEVSMGSIQPASVGQVVRIAGIGTDKFIDDVIGPAYAEPITLPTTATGLIPTGAILEYGGSTAPSGFLLCDGSTVSRTSYAALFAAIGTAYNTGGESSTEFRLPNFKGRVGVGRDAADTSFNTLGKMGGAKTHTLTVAEMPSHNHGGATGATAAQVNSQGHHYNNLDNVYAAGKPTIPTATATNFPVNLGSTVAHTHAIPAQGGGQAHNNLQPYTVINRIIKT